MPPIILPRGSYFRDVGKFPRLRMLNMMPEQTPLSNDGVAFIQRPGMAAFATTSGGNVRGMAAMEGRALVVTTANIEVVDTEGAATRIFSFVGTDRCRFAVGAGGAIVETNGLLVWYDGNLGLYAVFMPDGAPFDDVVYLNGYFFALRRDTDTIYWSDALQPQVWNPLSFVSAESSDDKGVGLGVVGGEIWLFGTQTAQPFYLSGESDAVIRPYSGRTMQRGCLARDTIVGLDNTLFFVGDDYIVYRIASVPEAVSQPWVSERLRSVPKQDITAWTYTLDGHAVYVLSLGPAGCLAYDVTTQTWGEWASYSGGWRAHLGCQVDGVIMAGDRLGPSIWRLDAGQPSDAGEVVMQRFVTGVMPVRQTVRVASVKLWHATGWGPLSGNGADPFIRLRTSDNGEEWVVIDDVKAGKTGEYSYVSEWRRLDPARYPHKLFRFEMSDPVPWRVTEATVNELW